MPLVSLMAHRQTLIHNAKMSFLPSQNQALGDLEILHCSYMEIERGSKRSSPLHRREVFSPTSSFQDIAISPSNFRLHWPKCKLSAEFLAALACISVPWAIVSVVKSETLKKQGVQDLTALDAIASGGIDKLPFGDSDFQSQLIERARYFSGVIRAQGVGSVDDYFPAVVQQEISTLDIFSKAALEEIEHRRPLKPEHR